MGAMLGVLPSVKAGVGGLKSRRAMLDTLLRHLPMVRLSVGAAVLVALAACNGLIEGGDGNLTPEQKAAMSAWTNKAYPHLQQQCIGCHSGSEADIAFLAGGSSSAVHDTLMSFAVQVVNLDAPESSRLLTKGAHAGPSLTAVEASDILEWIQAERDAAGVMPDQGLQTGKFTPLLCTGGNPGDPTCPVNHVALDGLGLPGASIDMVAQALSQDLYVTDLKLVPSVDGVYLEHPLFVSWPADPTQPEIPDTLDRFFSVKMNEMPSAAPDPIGGGTAAFVGFTPTNQVSIHFKVISKYMADSGSGAGSGTTQSGCRQLASFKQNAQGPLNTNCASCHSGTANANAKAAMDIDGIGSTDDAMIQLACNQVRSRINFQDTNSSSFYIAPDPGQATNHPFKFGGSAANFSNFKSAVDPWVQAEKTSQ
jgi:mono/diheme cytochrome c family protein